MIWASQNPKMRFQASSSPMSAGQNLPLPCLPAISDLSQKCRLPPPPTAPRDSVVLLQAIDKMDPETLREAFKKICTTAPKAMELSIKNLLVYRDSCDLEYGELVSNDDAARDAITRQMMANRGEPISEMKCAKYDACKNCDKVFDRCHNGIGDCLWHSGELELEYANDIWADEQSGCDKCLIDLHKAKLPNAFRWTCCEEQADAKGCMRTKHESTYLPPREKLETSLPSSASARPHKRQRIW